MCKDIRTEDAVKPLQAWPLGVCSYCGYGARMEGSLGIFCEMFDCPTRMSESNSRKTTEKERNIVSFENIT